MKYLTTILSVIIMTLSAIPCADAHTVVKQSSTNAKIADTDNNKKTEHSDTCSPFCVCNCCNTPSFVSYGPFPEENSPFELITKKVRQYYSSVFFSNFYGCIWQPPKIS